MTASVLIVTIPPLGGGVPDKTRILARHLRDIGHPVTVAHYATLTDYPDLVAPCWQWVRGKRPALRRGECFGDVPCIAVGCALPELEFTYYLPSAQWRDVIAAHDRHIAVGGTVMVSHLLTTLGIPHLVWCASTMTADRIDRRRAMPAARRVFDRMVVGPAQRRMEKRILAGPARFMTVSSYARRTLVAAGGNDDCFTTLPVPVDPARFTPPDREPRSGVIGFAGRPNDPRKNLPMLFDAVRILRDRGNNVELHLTGEANGDLDRAAKALEIADRIHWQGWLPDDGLPDFFRSLDVFVIPSFQEGLNIAGLQAMASGVPVVSTRCGGPEDYVIDGETGFLTDIDAGNLADAVERLTGDRQLRSALGANARRVAENDYSLEGFHRGLATAWQDVWQEQP